MATNRFHINIQVDDDIQCHFDELVRLIESEPTTDLEAYRRERAANFLMDNNPLLEWTQEGDVTKLRASKRLRDFLAEILGATKVPEPKVRAPHPDDTYYRITHSNLSETDRALTRFRELRRSILKRLADLSSDSLYATMERVHTEETGAGTKIGFRKAGRATERMLEELTRMDGDLERFVTRGEKTESLE